MVNVLNLTKCLIISLFLFLISFLPVSGQIVNGHFNSNLNNWTCAGDLSCDRGSVASYDTTYYARIHAEPTGNTTTTLSQVVDVTGYSRMELVAKGRIQESADRGGYMRMYVGGNYADLNVGWVEGLIWHEHSATITGTGPQTVRLEVNTWFRPPESYAGVVMRIDNVVLIPYPILSGYVEDSEGNPILAYLSLNNSEDPIESNATTGYYEFPYQDEGVYLLTVTKPTQQDYTAVINLTTHTEHNVSMTRLIPDLLSGPWILQTSQTHLMLGWTENSVVDSAKIYQGTSTNLIYTKDTSYTAHGSHTVGNLECGTPYTFWIQPMDGAIAGSKYEISEETDSCIVVAPLPIYTATPTPTETPDDGDDEEEGLIEIIDNTIEELTELFDEAIIEPTKVVIEEIITHLSTAFNWILLLFVYLSTLAGRIVNKREDVVEIIVDTALYGTIATIFILMLSFIGFSVIFSNELIAVVIFVIVGFVFGIAPEYLKSEDLPGKS